MSGTTGKGYSVSIGAVDNASKVLDQVNKRIHALSAPAERFGKAVDKFGEVTGINRLAEGLKTMGTGAADAFRSLDRLAGPMGAVTGAGTIAGMTLLTRRWAEFGQQISNVAYRLNTPVEKLGALHGAMRLAGGDAAAVDSGMRGLQDTISGAAWGRDAGAVQLFRSLNVQFADAQGNARQAANVLGDVADAIKGMRPETQARVLNQLGIGEGMLPLLRNGRQGLQDFQKQAEATGGVMSKEMVEHASKMNEAWQKLGLAIEGVGNRLVDKYAPAVTGTLERAEKWIEKNKQLADTITQIGSAVGLLAALKPAAWVLRLLGLGAVVEAAPAIAAAGAGLAAGAVAGQMEAPMVDDYGNVIGNWGGRDERNNPAYRNPLATPADPNGGLVGSLLRALGGIRLPGGGSGGLGRRGPPAPASQAAATAQRTHDLWRSKGYTEDQTAGILSGVNRESGFDPAAIDPTGSSYGLYQYTGSRLAAIQRRYNTRYPTEAQQNEYAAWEMSPEGPEHAVGEAVHGSRNAARASLQFRGGFERPKDPAEAMATGRDAAQFVGLYDRGPAAGTGGTPGNPGPHGAAGAQGNVRVDVNLRGAPPGTTAQVTTSGAVTAPPPRIELPMPGAR